MAKCKDCIHFVVCDKYTAPNESYPEVGGCKLFKSAADVVEVVRCKNCIHWGGVTFGNTCRRWSALLAGMKNCTQPDDFCSCGERKDGAE